MAKKIPANEESLFSNFKTGYILINDSDEHHGKFVFNWVCC